jgi:hypothetical protein
MDLAFSVASTDEQSHLRIRGAGNRHTVADIWDSAKVLLVEIAKHSHRKILLDYSQVRTKANHSDVFNISRIHERETPVLTRYIFAVIVNPLELEMEIFWEETNRKRGMNTKVFTSEQEAIAWLELQQ